MWTCVGAGPRFSFCPPGAQGAGLPRRGPSGAGMFSKRAACGRRLCCSPSSSGERRLRRPPETRAAGDADRHLREGGREERAPRRSLLAYPQGEAEMGRLRQMVRRRRADRQRRGMGGERRRKGQRLGGQRVIEKADGQTEA